MHLLDKHITALGYTILTLVGRLASGFKMVTRIRLYD